MDDSMIKAYEDAPQAPPVPPPSYNETTNEPLNLYELIRFMDTIYRKNKYQTREFVTLILGFSGLPQNHTGSAGLHRFDELLITTLPSLSQRFEELRMGLRYFATNFHSHHDSYPHSPPTSPPPHPFPMDISPTTFPELSNTLLHEIHRLCTSIAKTYDRVTELNKRMKPVLFKRTEHIFHKNFGLAKGWQMVHHIEPNIDDWVKWMGTLDARAACLKLDLERELDDPREMD